MILHVPACLARKQTCLYTFTYCHIINPSLIPHQCTTPSLYNCTRCLPNPSPTPIWVQLKPCPTHASAKGPTQTNRRPKEPGARQSKQTTTTTTRTSQATNKTQWMGWRTRTTPQCREAVDEGVLWKKAPLEGTSGTIVVDHALISLFFFFFCFHEYLLFFFTGKLPMIRLEMTWNSPHKCMLWSCPYFFLFLFLFFFFFWLLT